MFNRLPRPSRLHRPVMALMLLALAVFSLPGTSHANDLPQILSDRDAALYQQIFRQQEDGNWRAANELIGKLENRILLGHVQYQRYMHPTLYTSTYPELHMWMKDYADHPGADDLYRLAITRHRSDWKPTPRPENGGYLGGTGPGQPFHLSRPYKSKRKRSATTVNEVNHAERVVRRYLYRGQPTPAAEYIAKDKIKTLLDPVEYDRIRAKIAHSYFLYQKDDLAVEFADAALARSRKYVPLADWTVGLASWRQGHLEKAAKHFARLGKASRISGWTASRANWWASRTYLKLGQPTKSVDYLKRAASYPRTFYGLLALRQLGVKKPFSWDLPVISENKRQWLLKTPSVRRAIALSEAGQFYLAEQEIRSTFSRIKPDQAPLLIALSERIGTPSVAMRMGLYLWEHRDTTWDSAIYPLPQWKPLNGYKLDRALIYAFMRQESGFYPRAESPAGAKGLMQIMPATASYLAKDPSLKKRSNRKLFNPDYNLELGQKYLSYLMNYDDVGQNLFHLTIAYNGGPGNLIKWKKRAQSSDDPLFFVEAMHSRETRAFLKRVLTNFWIYRHRLGQDLPGLDDIAEGKWPLYRPQDNKLGKVADRAWN
ncbi:lytic transglycosylase domain-containing protein [Sneathiella chinensis]|nr:lytic transglycosylase domain-containing protein [Sneathiella chinensis]